MISLPPVPGTVWAVDTGTSLAARAIRVGAELSGRPALANHVVGVSHQDAHGTWWGIEGRPGGVGWVDLRMYLRAAWAELGNTNAAQPLTSAQRQAVTAAAVQLVGVPYDWTAGIAADSLADLGLGGLAARIDEMWGWPSDPEEPSATPGHVVCSSLYAWIYARLGLPAPAGGERCQPADWWAWNDSRGWAAAAAS